MLDGSEWTLSKYALVALDMDGTLLDENEQVSKETAIAIRDAMDAGVTVILSTGRAHKTAVPYARELGLNGPMVTVNGGVIWSNPEELYVQHLLDRQKVHQLYEIAKKYDAWYWAYSTKEVKNRANWNVDIDAEEWLKFGFTTEDDQVRARIMEDLRGIEGLELTNSSPHNIEINPIGIHKAAGVETVCNLLGITMSQVVAVGDSLNDMAVIRAAGLGVAMGNAQEEVKAAADVVVASNNENGIVEVIRRYVL